jgi:hypothetical protein
MAQGSSCLLQFCIRYCLFVTETGTAPSFEALVKVPEYTAENCEELNMTVFEIFNRPIKVLTNLPEEGMTTKKLFLVYIYIL